MTNSTDIEAAAGTLTLALAGHYSPLLIAEHEARFLEMPLGPPLGLSTARYPSARIELPGHAILLFDVGLERLRTCAFGTRGSLEERLDELVAMLRPPHGSEDDSAVLMIEIKRGD